MCPSCHQNGKHCNFTLFCRGCRRTCSWVCATRAARLFSSLDQSNCLFVALSLPSPSSMLKRPIIFTVTRTCSPAMWHGFDSGLHATNSIHGLSLLTLYSAPSKVFLLVLCFCLLPKTNFILLLFIFKTLFVVSALVRDKITCNLNKVIWLFLLAFAGFLLKKKILSVLR